MSFKISNKNRLLNTLSSSTTTFSLSESNPANHTLDKNNIFFTLVDLNCNTLYQNLYILVDGGNEDVESVNGAIYIRTSVTELVKVKEMPPFKNMENTQYNPVGVPSLSKISFTPEFSGFYYIGLCVKNSATPTQVNVVQTFTGSTSINYDLANTSSNDILPNTVTIPGTPTPEKPLYIKMLLKIVI